EEAYLRNRETTLQRLQLIAGLGSATDDGCNLRVLARAKGGRTSCRGGGAYAGQRHGFHDGQRSAVERIGQHDDTLDRRQPMNGPVVGKIDIDLGGERRMRARQQPSLDVDGATADRKGDRSPLI